MPGDWRDNTPGNGTQVWLHGKKSSKKNLALFAKYTRDLVADYCVSEQGSVSWQNDIIRRGAVKITQEDAENDERSGEAQDYTGNDERSEYSLEF